MTKSPICSVLLSAGFCAAVEPKSRATAAVGRRLRAPDVRRSRSKKYAHQISSESKVCL
jgi:hypothetical protein